MDKDRNLSAQSVGSPDDIQHRFVSRMQQLVRALARCLWPSHVVSGPRPASALTVALTLALALALARGVRNLYVSSKDVTGKDKTIVLKAKTGNPDIDSDALGDRDTVTWSSVEDLVKEGEEWAKVKVLRWGMLHTPVTIEYKLVNLNLMPEAFEEQSDQVVMVG